MMGDGRWGTRHWRRSAEYTETGGEEADRTKRERKTGKMLVEQVTRMNLGGGGKEGTKPSRQET